MNWIYILQMSWNLCMIFISDIEWAVLKQVSITESHKRFLIYNYLSFETARMHFQLYSIVFNTFQQSWKSQISSVCPSVSTRTNSRKYSSNIVKILYAAAVWYSMVRIENDTHGTKNSSTQLHKSIPINYSVWGDF